MTRRGWAIAAALAVGLVAWAGFGGGRAVISAGLAAGAGDRATPGDYGEGYEHLAQPGEFGAGRILHPHSLLRRPGRLGGERAHAAQYGWAWFAAPPSEETL